MWRISFLHDNDVVDDVVAEGEIDASFNGNMVVVVVVMAVVVVEDGVVAVAS